MSRSRGNKSMLNQVYGDDTESFLEDLLNDDFKDWQKEQSNSAENSNKAGKTPQQKALPDPVKEKEPVRKREPVQESPKAIAKTPQPPRKWTRFPKRIPPPAQEPVSESPPERKPAKGKSKGSNDASVREVADLLRQMELESNMEEDYGSEVKFEERHLKMEHYLQDLRHDGKRKGGQKTGESTRRSSVSSQESTSSGSSQERNSDLRYSSACTLEELIEFKMRDVEDKSNDNICDTWVDDVELALMLIKRGNRGNSLNKDDTKQLLQRILEHK